MALLNKYVHYLIMYLSVDLMIVEGATSKQTAFRQITWKAMCTGNYTLLTTGNVSLLYCLTVCTMYSDCKGVRFESSTRKCHGCDGLREITRVSDPGSVYYFEPVRYNGIWGTICDDFWTEISIGFTDKNVKVTCSMLGYAGGGDVLPKAMYKSNLSLDALPIWMDDVQCTGNELSIFHCPQWSYTGTPPGCVRDEDVNVVCYP